MAKTFYLTGGWGYRNLGDDAILIATIKLLRKRHAGCRIKVSSYLPKETRELLCSMDCVEVVPSYHRVMFGDTLQYIFCPPKKPGLTYRVRYKLYSLFVPLRNSFLYWLFEKSSRLYSWYTNMRHSELMRQLEDVSCCVLAGGGYINESKEGNIAHCMEIANCQKLGIELVAVGQTFGPFESGMTRRIMSRWLNHCTMIRVRDTESLRDLRAMGLAVDETIYPDTALTDCKRAGEKRKTVAVIPFFGMKERMADFADVIETFCRRHTEYNVVVTLSQQWTLFEKFCEQLNRDLLVRKLDSRFVNPKDVVDLEALLAGCDIVVSQNLHGLIIAYRNGTKVLALNRRRKFVSFMQQIGYEDGCLSMEDFDSEQLSRQLDRLAGGEVCFKPVEGIAANAGRLLEGL